MTYALHFGLLCSLINSSDLISRFTSLSNTNCIIKLNTTIISVYNTFWVQLSVIRLLISFDDLISKYTSLTNAYYICYPNAIIIMSHNLLITYMAYSYLY